LESFVRLLLDGILVTLGFIALFCSSWCLEAEVLAVTLCVEVDGDVLILLAEFDGDALILLAELDGEALLL
jgi:hypothetical protein